jgi:hypothetical protein
MIYPQQLTIQLRKRQLVNIFGNPVFYTGSNPIALTETVGTIDTTWFDFTEYVDGIDEVVLEWTVEQGETGRLQDGVFSTPKSVSGDLSFERDAYEFIKAWLVEDVAAPLNQIEVQITDNECGRYIGYVITSRQLEWCQYAALCVFNLNLKQVDDVTQCIQRTLINDNWNGWFQSEPFDNTTGFAKYHPRFTYCIEKRPNWTLVLLWTLTSYVAIIISIVYTILFPLLIVIYTIRLIIYGIIVVINALIGVINAIIDVVNTLPGVSIPNIDPIDNPVPDPPVTPIEVLANFANIMMETAGCGREHVAPLVRDYLTNVCNKCGIRIDATSAPVFFSPMLTVIPSDNNTYVKPNPHFNACYLKATVKRGIRRFRKINLFTGESDPDTTTFWQRENAPNISGEMFLNEICKLYNQQWRLILDPATSEYQLQIYRVDKPYTQPPLFDFSFGGADRPQIIDGICYEPQEVNYPAYMSFLYDDDPSDKCGVEANDFYNGVQNVTFGNSIINPLFEGELQKNSGFGATRFNCDGVTTNYLYDAMQAVFSISNLGVIFVPPLALLFDELQNKIQQYGDYKILMQSETMSLPKMLIWDGDTANPSSPNYKNANAIKDKINIAGTVYVIGKSGYTGTVPLIAPPEINPLYPTLVPDTVGTVFVPSTITAAEPWIDIHPPNTSVNMKFPDVAAPTGVYQVTNIFTGVEMSAAAILVNFPMYFEPHYKDTLFDWFHFCDDPRRYPKLNKKWMLKIPLCCDNIEILRLTNTINEQKLLNSVLLDTTYYNVGIVTSITASYKQDEEIGKFIQLRGIV